MKELLLLETEHTTIEQSRGYRIPGYLIVQPKAPCTRLGELSAAQSEDLFRCVSRAETLVYEILQPGRVYVMKFAEMNPQVHFHIFPRTAELEEAYLTQVDDQPPINGARVTEWTWRQHASLGHQDNEIANFVNRAKDWLAVQPK